MAMTIERAKHLQERWRIKKKNNPELKCNHSDLEKERFYGMHTGDYICTTCGEAFTFEEKRNL